MEPQPVSLDLEPMPRLLAAGYREAAPLVACPDCGRLMHRDALTCGNYCRWDELVASNLGTCGSCGSYTTGTKCPAPGCDGTIV